jgi:hypothetical protein
MYGGEQNIIVIGRRIKQDKKAVARRPFSFRVMYENAQNVLRRRGIVAIMILGTKTSVPYAGIRGRNESAAHRCLSGSREGNNTGYKSDHAEYRRIGE